MGLRGPAPKPTAIRKLEGNPSRRPFPANEPIYPAGAPKKPKGLTKAESAIWNELVPLLTSAGVLRGDIDQFALSRLCKGQAELMKFDQGFRSDLAVIMRAQRKDGLTEGQAWIRLLSNPAHGKAWNKRLQLAQSVNALGREFGLTPSSRSRIDTVADGSGVDALEMKLCG